jgi:hypothetical protein
MGLSGRHYRLLIAHQYHRGKEAMKETKQKQINTLFPGLPRYMGPVAGWFALLHHDTLVEFSWNVIERVTYVEENKPTNQIGLRLRHMLFVKPLPDPNGPGTLLGPKPSRKEVLKLLKKHIKDCKWVEERRCNQHRLMTCNQCRRQKNRFSQQGSIEGTP